MFERRKHLTGSPVKIRDLAQGCRVLCVFLFSAASLSSNLGEESYLAKKEIRNKKAVQESSMRVALFRSLLERELTGVNNVLSTACVGQTSYLSRLASESSASKSSLCHFHGEIKSAAPFPQL
ncbi:homeodomain-only protein isoform X2 [Pteronotus mesoamericanus]|uniref:homeodomain-only protein isoform X2 n=1 Tax=Pteronotus mesoamericanus TaxID=1884717 RepID=UPI0023ED39E5|nr:homeodomain-only protein isoform X2 [Pteronotus parnellii mesoamericanus]